ncbi:MAG: sarcosine oxidase subunit delta [Erythrobacter sp.]|uniref:sarcosine oxidase subunit delta n=1 Tax=Erythrobacter sp. TaxID=1042 RepID=UPI002638AAF2|nr:sarcosine oxidase subunit delta [Erythrobacter sp.]MDJ0978182.1 sarcosine oxidase subunit delta [Erythrobacter sp.]
MLSIPCPHCGLRDEDEFVWGGEAHLVRPRLDCSAEEWAQYLFYRDNPKGIAFERWHHRFGCGQWFNLVRNTATHTIEMSYLIDAQRPDL